jgi:hypothetical protein
MLNVLGRGSTDFTLTMVNGEQHSVEIIKRQRTKVPEIKRRTHMSEIPCKSPGVAIVDEAHGFLQVPEDKSAVIVSENPGVCVCCFSFILPFLYFMADGTFETELCIFRNVIGGTTTADEFCQFVVEVIDYANKVRRNQRVSS